MTWKSSLSHITTRQAPCHIDHSLFPIHWGFVADPFLGWNEINAGDLHTEDFTKQTNEPEDSDLPQHGLLPISAQKCINSNAPMDGKKTGFTVHLYCVDVSGLHIHTHQKLTRNWSVSVQEDFQQRRLLAVENTWGTLKMSLQAKNTYW